MLLKRLHLLLDFEASIASSSKDLGSHGPVYPSAEPKVKDVEQMENSVQSWHCRTPPDPLIKSQSQSEPGRNINKNAQQSQGTLGLYSTTAGVCSAQVQAQNEHSLGTHIVC